MKFDWRAGWLSGVGSLGGILLYLFLTGTNFSTWDMQFTIQFIQWAVASILIYAIGGLVLSNVKHG